MKIYKVWIQIEEIDESKDHYLNLDSPYEAGKFDTETTARRFVENELMRTKVTGSAADLLEACKVLTSYTMDLLYRLDNQINLDDVEEIQQTKEAIAKYNPVETLSTKLRNVCQQMLDTLDIGGEQARQFAEEIEMLRDALKAAPVVKDDCPKCGAGSDEREFASRDFLGIEAIHMHYLCKKCGSEIIKEFTLTDVFIDNPTV
jgi:cell fate (sporulation/competence/biofilm development) regulator YmcA (YheA/YmcA/DUF963 family)